jgi:heat shock protein HtpX
MNGMERARRNRWYERDRGLTARMALALVAVADAAALALLALIGVPVWLVIGVGLAFLASQILLGPPIALALFGARRVGPEDEPELHALIERLCQLANFRKPGVAVAEVTRPPPSRWAAVSAARPSASRAAC